MITQEKSGEHMSEVKHIKDMLIQDVRDGKVTPTEAFASFEKISPTQIRTGRIYEQKDQNERISQYRESRAIRRAIRANRVPFISKQFLPGMWLSQGLALVGAKSGRAKSTTASNVLSGFLRSVPDKSAIIISNEEATDAIYERTACILLELNYIELSKGNFSLSQEKAVEECIEQFIIPRVEVVEDGKFNMSYIEDVQSVLETAATDKVGIVLVDYLQCITQSRNEPSLEAFQISKKLGLYFKEYGKQHGVPVVCFAQLSDGAAGADFAGRVQNDKTIYNHAFLAIEIEPDFETCTATFRVHKDRFFGNTGKEVVMDFKGGRYEIQGGESL
jgi:predicted ATP-dependent serine protease